MKHLTNFFKKSAVAIGISIIFPLLIVTAFDLMYQRPQHPARNDALSSEEVAQQRKVWNSKYQSYLFYYFCVATLTGCLVIVAGALTKIDFLASGFITGGVFTIVSGFFYYWHYLQQFFQVGALLIALILLVLCGYFFIERRQ